MTNKVLYGIINIEIKKEVMKMSATKKYTFEDFMKLISSLANSQGFYSRLKRHIDSYNNEQRRDLRRFIERQNFKDDLDVIMFLESN